MACFHPLLCSLLRLPPKKLAALGLGVLLLGGPAAPQSLAQQARASASPTQAAGQAYWQRLHPVFTQPPVASPSATQHNPLSPQAPATAAATETPRHVPTVAPSVSPASMVEGSPGPAALPNAPALPTSTEAVTSPAAAPTTDKAPEAQAAQPTTSSEIPRAFNYGVYHQRLATLDLLRAELSQAMALATDLGELTRSREQTVQARLAQANAAASQFQTLYLAQGESPESQAAYQQAERGLLDLWLSFVPSSHVEARTIWLDRGTLVSCQTPEALRQKLRQLYQAGFNVIYFEAVNAGYPMYASRILPKNPLAPADWDPLQVAVEEGHRLGMEVHAWVWCFAVGNVRHNRLVNQPDSYTGPVLAGEAMQPDTQKPWTELSAQALRGVAGNMIPGKGKQHEYWLSPASGPGRNLLRRVYEEIVRNYEVDGLQLDYIRYPFQSFYQPSGLMGFEPIGRKRFEAESGLSLTPPLSDSTLKLWTAWKTFQVSTFVRDVSESLKTIRPNLMLSAAVYPMRRAERILAIQQDWETWLERRWLDTLSPMTYMPSPEGYDASIGTMRASLEAPALIYPGVGLHRLSTPALVTLLETAKEAGVLGTTMFATAHLNDDILSVLAKGPHRDAVQVLPHRNPARGVALLWDAFAPKLAAMLRNTGATDVADTLAPTFVTMQQSIAQINTPTQVAVAETASLSPQLPVQPMGQAEAFQQLEEALHTLQSQLQQWLDAPTQRERPYRAGFIQHGLARLQRLSAYARFQKGLLPLPPDKLGPLKPPVQTHLCEDATAESMCLRESQQATQATPGPVTPPAATVSPATVVPAAVPAAQPSTR